MTLDIVDVYGEIKKAVPLTVAQGVNAHSVAIMVAGFTAADKTAGVEVSPEVSIGGQAWKPITWEDSGDVIVFTDDDAFEMHSMNALIRFECSVEGKEHIKGYVR
jgi:hypothetical protein